MLSKKSLLMSLAVLSLVGCGSSKDSKTVGVGGGTAQPAPTNQIPQTTDPAQSPAPVPIPAGPSNQNRSQDRSGQSNPNNDFQTDLDQNQNSQSGNSSHTNHPSHGGGHSNSGSSSVLRPDVDLQQDVLPRAATVNFSEVEAVKTGGQLDNLFFTSSSSDGLMAEFRSYNNKVNAEQKQMNLNLAKGITLAKVSRQNSDGTIILDLTVDEFAKSKTYKLKATEENDQYKLTLVSKTGDLEFQGGFLKCTDSDGGCENSYAKVKLSGAYVRIIFRSSYADKHFNIPSENTSAGSKLWNTYVLNTVDRVETKQKLDYMQVSSFEVVNGRSGMGIVLITDDKELVGLSAPLLAPEKGTAVSAPVTKLTDLSKSYDLNIASTYSQKLSQTIKDVKLTRNNGLGDVRLKLDVSDVGSVKNFIWITISKMNKGTMSVSDVQEFEKSLKPF